MGKFNTILESKRKTNILLFICRPDENIRILTATVKTKFWLKVHEIWEQYSYLCLEFGPYYVEQAGGRTENRQTGIKVEASKWISNDGNNSNKITLLLITNQAL